MDANDNMKLSRQQEIIVTPLRDGKWHCASEWYLQVKDDRARISNLNRFYMAEKGFVIKGEPGDNNDDCSTETNMDKTVSNLVLLMEAFAASGLRSDNL